ncbi:MAG: hypothetical protein WAU69_08395 [Solirubrobacteraceae bacterium]
MLQQIHTPDGRDLYGLTRRGVLLIAVLLATSLSGLGVAIIAIRDIHGSRAAAIRLNCEEMRERNGQIVAGFEGLVSRFSTRKLTGAQQMRAHIEIAAIADVLSPKQNCAARVRSVE